MRKAPKELNSPNQDDRPGGVDTLVLHYTGMLSGQAAIDRLCDPSAKVSSHYVVEEDGTVLRLVPEASRAWHAGISFWRGRHGLNDVSIGIEIVNPGHEWGYRPFPATQMATVTALCLGILARWEIPAVNVVGHSDVSPDRKQDPGELFDWQGLASAGVGLWPTDGVPAVRDDEVEQALKAIGYPVADLPATIMAFQRRWVPGSVSGMADEVTRRRIAAVLSAYRGEIDIGQGVSPPTVR